MFTNTDILTLAKAGFTAEQIAALNMVGTQPAPAPQVTQPAQVTQPQPQPAQVTQPQPAQETQPLPIMATPQAQPTQPATQAATVDDVLKAINGLNTTMQNGFLQGSQQPTPPTAESILAEIINPPTKESK